MTTAEKALLESRGAIIRAAKRYAKAVYAARRQVHDGGDADLRLLELEVAHASGEMEACALASFPDEPDPPEDN